MIFHRITLCNIFSYRGEQTFELAPSGDGTQRLCLVLGRNGFGKTSLLNATKLLFLGTEDKGLRGGMARAAYVLGDEAKWSGILNRQARAAGIDNCWIRAEIGTSDKVVLVAKRSWNLNGSSFSPDNEVLEVEAEERSFAGDRAQSRLEELLPRELVPFFFFDGEEIRYLAEASDVHRAEAMERLLSLSFVNGVESELAGLTREWRREELPQEIQAQIAGEEARSTALAKSIEALEAKEINLDAESRKCQEDMERLQHRMENLRSGGGFANTELLDVEIAELEKGLQEKQNQLAYELASDAPLIANPQLLAGGIEPLQAAVDRKTKANESVLETLFKVLPERLFGEPPYPRDRLSDDQVRFYIKKLRGILDTFGVSEDESEGLFDELDLMRARVLLERIRGYNVSMRVLRADRARRLRDVSRLRSLLEDKQAERREAQYGSSEMAEQYRSLEEELGQLNQTLGRLEGEAESAREQIQAKSDEKKSIEGAVKTLERRENDAWHADKRLRIANALGDSFKRYRQVRRTEKRNQIEKVLNSRFSQLMSGHGLIKSIKIDEDFYLSYWDDSGEPVGASSISHGMRQLVVTALLWALKDVSNKSLPIIVDTPLARIDRENQENLLKHYYPNAGEQVVVLATDSEIDERKYEVIKRQMSRVFVLDNPDGETTKINEVRASGKTGPQWKRVING